MINPIESKQTAAQIDRRESARIEADDDSCIAFIFCASQCIPARICDISSGGIGVKVLQRSGLKKGSSLAVQYQGLTLAGLIANTIDVDDDLTRVGIKWKDPDDTKPRNFLAECESWGETIQVGAAGGGKIFVEQTRDEVKARILITPIQLKAVVESLAYPSSWNDSECVVPGPDDQDIKIQVFDGKTFTISQGGDQIVGSGDIREMIDIRETASELEKLETEAPTDKKILIIDDDEFTCNVINRFLLSEGFTRVESTTDSREAVSAVKQSNPDLILLDLMMPYNDGLAVLEQLRDNQLLSKTAVVMLTAVEDELTREHALSLGAADFVNKPISAAELLTRISNIFI